MMKILMLEDVEDDVGLIRRALTKGGLVYESVRVDNREEFTDRIQHYHPNVILSDHSLPQFNSIEALRICKQLDLQIPFILVTGAVSEEFAVTCLKLGADDYVLKSNLSRLPSAIENALRQRYHNRQRKKAERELRLQYEELVKVNEELDNFVYSVSHNIRAPLMSVLGLLNLATREDLDKDKHFQQYFGMMSHSIKKLDETLREILDYSRNARNEIQFQEIDIKRIIDESFGRLKYLDGAEQVARNIVIVQDHPFYSDGYRLSIVLSNLISNAIQYRDIHKEKCTLDIHVLIREKTAVFSIEDNGIGIDKELLPKVFNMFFRATEKSSGAGLGLYIVRETIRKLNGEISVDSKLGHGTRFSMEVPNHIAQASINDNTAKAKTGSYDY